MANALKTAVLLGAMSALFLLIGEMAGGQTGLLIAFGIALVMNFGSYWFADKIVLRMHKAQEVGPDHPLHRMVERLAGRAGLPMPKVYIIPTESPNAFATGRNPKHAAVAATQGIMRILSEDELAGVMAHELAHVQNRDILISSVAATIGAAIMLLSRFAFFFGGNRDRGGNPIAMIAMMLLAPLAAMIIQAAISRAREFSADRDGAQIAGSPNGLAGALRKIEGAVKQRPLQTSPAVSHMYIIKPFSGRGVLSLFSTHPPTDERIRRLTAVG
jgi:heat shock protein HtpX